MPQVQRGELIIKLIEAMSRKSTKWWSKLTPEQMYHVMHEKGYNEDDARTLAFDYSDPEFNKTLSPYDRDKWAHVCQMIEEGWERTTGGYETVQGTQYDNTNGL